VVKPVDEVVAGESLGVLDLADEVRADEHTPSEFSLRQPC
jgi:hypothetical protein